MNGSRNPHPRRRQRAGLFLLATIALAGAIRAEETIELPLLDNGDFTERPDPDSAPIRQVPWWKTPGGSKQLVLAADRSWLETGAETAAVQPLAAFRPLAAHTTISGRVAGAGVITITDGGGREVRITFDEGATDDDQGRTFALTLGELLAERERFAAEGITVDGDLEAFVAPIPRLVLELSAVPGAGPARWTDLEGRVTLPCPSEAELRAEILELLHPIVAKWEEHVIDHETGFARFIHDIVTGERLYTRGGGLHPVFSILLEAAAHEPEPRWVELNERFLEAWFAHCFNPETGLPRMWNPRLQVGRDDKPTELYLPLDLLHDLATNGSERWREPALAQLRKIGEHVLANGVIPDGNVAPGYYPGSGEPFQQYPHLRRLDVPAQLARFGALTGDPRYLTMAREAVVTYEYTWLWPGTWDAIDPGLDDNYGHYGARALMMWQAWPEEQTFRRVARGGYDYYLPLWRDALRFGGNVAADQVRCWEIVADLVELEPERLPEVTPLLRAAARLHFKGEQYENGAWGDVTVYDFDPKAGLQVGDLPGMPQNLLHGLALVYREDLGLRDAEIRAMFTAVMRSSAKQYREPHGYLIGRRRLAGANPAGGSLRFAVGLVEMLGRLSE